MPTGEVEFIRLQQGDWEASHLQTQAALLIAVGRESSFSFFPLFFLIYFPFFCLFSGCQRA